MSALLQNMINVSGKKFFFPFLLLRLDERWKKPFGVFLKFLKSESKEVNNIIKPSTIIFLKHWRYISNVAISIYRPCRRAHDFKNWRQGIISLHSQDFHCLPAGISLLEKIQKDNGRKKRKNFHQFSFDKKYSFILRN